MLKNRCVSKITTPGHLYFIQGAEGGLIKIGWATVPETRMAHLQAHSPVRLALLHTEPGNGKEEAALHKQFAAARSHGEWFRPVPALMTEIEARHGRNTEKVYEPGKPLPEPIVSRPRRPRQKRPERLGPPRAPTSDYWEPGNPGWDKLVLASKALE